PIHAFAEKIAQLKHSLRCMGILARNGATHSRRMNPDFLCDFFDHHRLELVNALFEEVTLAGDDGITNLQNRLLSLFNVLNELNGALEAFLYIIAGVAIVAVFAEQLSIGGIQT